MIFKNNFHWLNASLLLVFVSTSTTVLAMGDTGKNKSETVTNNVQAKSSASYYWYDGKQKGYIRQDATLVAELVAPGTSSVLQSKLAAARSAGKQTSAIVKLWDVSAAGGANQSLATLNTGSKVSVSPVFTSSLAGGQHMALPGGILVTFKADWDEQKVKQWLTKKGLAVKKKMTFGNIYLLESQPGMTSLTLANSIYESGEVEGASPNWWHDVRPF